MSNLNLTRARKTKNDEFYTRLPDIEKELSNYSDLLKDKVIYCNCDDYNLSNFWKYFHLNFSKLQLKKLIATNYSKDDNAFKAEYTGGSDEDVTTGNINHMAENGDFRSPECIELLKEADIIVTNPPFSLFREYVAQLIEYKKDFIILGNINAITYKEIFPLIKEGKIFTGHNFNKTLEFIMPDDYVLKGKAYVDDNGRKHGFVPAITWFTNIDTPKRHENITLFRNYNEQDYPKYDNYDAIDVSKVSDIPEDYLGIMGVPITFLDKYNPDQFDLLGMTSGRNEFDKQAWPTKKYINPKQHNKDGSIVNGSKMNTSACIYSQSIDGIYYTDDSSDKKLSVLYTRLLIKRK